MMAALKQVQSEREKYYAEHPWPTGETRQNLPHVNWEFSNAENPQRVSELQDIQKTEKQRRDDAQGRNSQMVTLDKPLPTHRPKHRFRQAADRASFNARWMNEQKEAAFASNDEFMKALKEKELLEPERSYQPQRFER